MAVKVGGIQVSALPTRAANEGLRELRSINGKVDYSDYVVDLCFLTYVTNGMGAEYAAGVGISPGMVGRKQHRFAINLEVPPTVIDRPAFADWLDDALAQAAAVIREYLPKKGKTYPAERLAQEVEVLRTRWNDHVRSAPS